MNMNLPKLLIIGYVWPEPESSAAGSRMMQLIRFFLKDHQVYFVTTAAPSPFMVDLEGLGVQTGSIELNSDSFDVFIREYLPDVVLFDRFMMEEQFGWRVTENCPGAMKILDTEDLHFLRKARQEAVKDGIEITESSLFSEVAKREVASIYRCDLSLIISEKEMSILSQLAVPAFILHYLPLLEVDQETEAGLPPFGERKHFISIGNFLHEPNWDAVLQLKKSIWPMIRKDIPDVELHIYGAYPTQKVFQLNAPRESFFIKGRAASAREVIKASRILLAPLRFGAGIKGKFIDSMSVGTPSVTTSIGAEAMAGNLSWGGMIRDDPEEFARAATKLYQDKELWEKARENGFRLLQSRFARSLFEEKLQLRLSNIRENLQKHREKNFTGAMLQQHQVNSTRYLSKYIETKNKLLHLLNAKNAQ